MTTNEIKKDMMVRLANGWKARIEDNKKGNTRMATVYGMFTEMGSIYAHDIVAVFTDKWIAVEHTPAQIKLRNTVNAVFNG